MKKNYLRKYCIYGLIVVATALVFPSGAMSNHLNVDYKVYIPHLTGLTNDWSDILVVNNKGPLLQTFTVTLYNAGLQVGQESYLVQPNEEDTVDIKMIAPTATLGIVEYHSAYLTFRMDYRHMNGGLAEFRLNDQLYDQAIFNFNNIFPDVVATKGIALANFENFAANVTLHAIGANRQVLGSEVVSLNRRSRIVGLHSTWFPGVPFEDITGIIVSSTEAKIGGITISSNPGITALLFTQSADASTFTQEVVSEQVRIEDYFPVGSYTYEGTDGVSIDYDSDGQDIVMRIYVDGHFLQAFFFRIDEQGALRYKEVEYPFGQKWTNSPFELIPAQADLNRSFTKSGTWDQVNKYSSDYNNAPGTVEVSLEGPFYTVVEAGTFPGVLKIGMVDKVVVGNHFQYSSAVNYDFVTFWLSDDYGIVKMVVNGFQFEISSRQNN